MSWSSAGSQTNPSANAILADTGQMVAGRHSLTLVVTSTAAAVVILEWRDAANSANNNSQTFAVAASGLQQFTVPDGIEFTADNERLRLRLNAGITGVIHASLFCT